MPREPDAGAAKGANWKFKWARWEEIRALFRACVDKVGFESRIRKKGKLAEWIGVLDNGAITPRRARKWVLWNYLVKEMRRHNSRLTHMRSGVLCNPRPAIGATGDVTPTTLPWRHRLPTFYSLQLLGFAAFENKRITSKHVNHLRNSRRRYLRPLTHDPSNTKESVLFSSIETWPVNSGIYLFMFPAIKCPIFAILGQWRASAARAVLPAGPIVSLFVYAHPNWMVMSVGTKAVTGSCSP